MYIKPNKNYQVGYYPYTKEMMKQVAWCLRNDISVSLRYGGKPKEFYVEIKIKDRIYADPKGRRYPGMEALEKMYEYYAYYYNKYNENKENE